MPSNEKIVREELLLPNIVLFNQLFVEAQRINGHNKDYEVKTRLPNLEATSKPVCSCICRDEAGSKNNLKPSISKQYSDYIHSPLEFVNIVDHAPIEMKFLSRTEIREPQLGAHDICTRWLERVARTFQEEVMQTRSALEMHQDVQQINSQSKLMADWELNQSNGVNECAEVLLRCDRVSMRCNDSLNLSGKAYSAPLQKDEIGWRTPQGKCLYPDKQNLGREEDISKANEEVDQSLNIGNGCELLFQFSAKRMDLIERDGTWGRKEIKTSQGRKSGNGYEISIDLLKPKGYCGASNEEKNQQRNEVKQKVCLRFERRFKSAPKERTGRNNDETIKSNKVHLYPFYEAKWTKNKNVDKDCEYFIIKDSQRSPKKDTNLQFIDCRKSLVNIESPTVANEHLKISSLQLVPKNSADEGQKTDSKSHFEERRKKESIRNVMKVVCSTKKLRTNGHEEEDGIDEGTFDVDNLLTINSVSLRETLKLLGRITASSMLLTDNQILKLMESGNLNISKFLLIKKLLLSIHPSKYVSIAKEGQSRKEIATLLSAVLEFIDRCEKILKKAKGLSSLELYEKNDTDIDCTKRGIVIGKMPPISVMSYNYKSDVENDDLLKEESTKKKKNNKMEPIKRNKIHAKKDNEEENLVEQAVSIASLRKSILVRAVDLVMNNHWERSHSLKKRYMPKRKKIKSLKPFYRSSHKKHMSSVATAKQQIKKRCHPPPSTAPSSRNSVSTSFLSDELQDVHIPTAQSVVNEITNDVNGGSLELIPDMKEDKSVPKDELYMDNKKRMNDEDTALKVAQDQKPMPHKVCEFLKGRVESKLRATFDLYPKIHKLISILHDKTEDMVDIRAARDMKTDFKSHFKLIEVNRYEMYCKAFAKTDIHNDGYIPVEMVKDAVKLVDSVASCPAKYIDCTLTVLDMLVLPKVSIKMFCIVCGILERMLEGGIVIHEAVDSLDLLMSEGKMIWYKDMFYESSDLDKNYVNLETVKLELFAGGMDTDKERQISDKIVNKENQQISYLDFIAYIPLFISIHEKICANAFD